MSEVCSINEGSDEEDDNGGEKKHGEKGGLFKDESSDRIDPENNSRCDDKKIEWRIHKRKKKIKE